MKQVGLLTRGLGLRKADGHLPWASPQPLSLKWAHQLQPQTENFVEKGEAINTSCPLLVLFHSAIKMLQQTPDGNSPSALRAQQGLLAWTGTLAKCLPGPSSSKVHSQLGPGSELTGPGPVPPSRERVVLSPGAPQSRSGEVPQPPCSHSNLRPQRAEKRLRQSRGSQAQTHITPPA